MTRCVNSVVQLLCFPSFSHSKFHYSFPTWEFFACPNACTYVASLNFSDSMQSKPLSWNFTETQFVFAESIMDRLRSHSLFVTNQRTTSVSLAQTRGNKMVFPMALLGWTWKLNIVVMNVSFAKCFFIPQPAVCPNIKSVRGNTRKVNSFMMVDVFLVMLVDLAAFWLCLPSWPVQSQH